MEEEVEQVAVGEARVLERSARYVMEHENLFSGVDCGKERTARKSLTTETMKANSSLIQISLEWQVACTADGKFGMHSLVWCLARRPTTRPRDGRPGS